MKLAFYPTKYARLIERIEQSFPEIDVVRIDEPEEIAAKLPGVEILVTSNRSYTPEAGRAICTHGTALRWVQFTTSGIDTGLRNGIPAGIPVTNGGGMHAHSVAAHAMTLMLAVMRRLNDCTAARPQRRWIRDEVHSSLATTRGKTMALIGLGAIGQDIARKAKAFDMKVIAVSQQPRAANVDEIRPRERLHETLGEADVAVVATSYDPTTHHLIDAAALAAMKPGSMLVNVARGSLVDEPALIAALQNGTLAAAGIDVAETEPLPADSPLWDMANVVLTPHTGGAGADNNDALFDVVSRNIKLYLAGQPFDRVVHGPNPNA
ncbi:MAG: D-2-hydroxyacid dehydrogenase [Alphaproteobacteria bacterium]